MSGQPIRATEIVKSGMAARVIETTFVPASNPGPGAIMINEREAEVTM